MSNTRSLVLSSLLIVMCAATMYIQGAMPLALTLSPGIMAVIVLVGVLVGQAVHAFTRAIFTSLTPAQQRDYFRPVFCATLVVMFVLGIGTLPL